jgi:hemolysin activation/secretion protein
MKLKLNSFNEFCERQVPPESLETHFAAKFLRVQLPSCVNRHSLQTRKHISMRMFKPRYLSFVLLASAQIAHGQTAPSAGTQLQQLPLPPNNAPLAPTLEFKPVGSLDDASDTGARVRVAALDVTGQTVFTKAELLTATEFTPGSDLTLKQLRVLAARIADYYHARGYFVAQAYLPAQDIQNGRVIIAVIEGRYGKIDLRNTANISTGTLAARLDGLGPGDLVMAAPLERRLLLLSDIPGVHVTATLAPGSEAGTSDLIVDAQRGPRFSGDIEADDGGARSTGVYRFGGTINLNNPLGAGDQFSVRLLASDSGLAYGRASYQAPIGNATLGVAYAHLHYTLGREFAALNGSGTADIFSGYGRYPLVRSRRADLYALGEANYKLLRDDLGIVSSHSDKRIAAGTLGLAGDSRDDIGGGGTNVFSLGWTIGNLDIRSPVERAIDASTARSAGGFKKLQGSAARLQTAAGPLSLYAAIRWQYAFNNLDSSEKMELGGAYGVRAYPEGEAFGDTGYIVTTEARLLLGGQPSVLPGRFELTAFIETGGVRFAHDPWFSGPNYARRSGYGAGVNWTGPEGILIRTSYARKLGTGPSTSAPDRSGRFWFQIVKLF